MIETKVLRDTLVNTTACLCAAISLLERAGRSAKRAAPSDKMFAQMILDYKRAAAEAQAVIRKVKAQP